MKAETYWYQLICNIILSDFVKYFSFYYIVFLIFNRSDDFLNQQYTVIHTDPDPNQRNINTDLHILA